MKKSRGILSLILVAALSVLLGVTTIRGLDSEGIGAAKNINLGLDLEGGVSITYQVKGDKPSQEDMDDTVYKMQRRVEQYSTEAQAYQEGDNRISIEIPGVEDANAILEELGQPGSLYFMVIQLQRMSGTALKTQIKTAFRSLEADLRLRIELARPKQLVLVAQHADAHPACATAIGESALAENLLVSLGVTTEARRMRLRTDTKQ